MLMVRPCLSHFSWSSCICAAFKNSSRKLLPAVTQHSPGRGSLLFPGSWNYPELLPFCFFCCYCTDHRCLHKLVTSLHPSTPAVLSFHSLPVLSNPASLFNFYVLFFRCSFQGCERTHWVALISLSLSSWFWLTFRPKFYPYCCKWQVYTPHPRHCTRVLKQTIDFML